MESEINKLQKDYQEGRTSCEATISDCLQKVKNSTRGSVNFLLAESALARAKETDKKLKKGEKLLPLEGIPFGAKDVYLIQGHPASGSSSFLGSYIAPYTATSIQRLLDVGAILIAKENCDSFGHGSTNENSAFGSVKNALDESKVAGGSSGGSAVNVARGHTVFSIGGDTGGSIRQPSGYNKVYGLKPTYGRVSRFGLMAYASSTDCVGPLARSVEDIQIVMNVMGGKDALDLTTRSTDKLLKANVENVSKLRIGYYKQFLEAESIDEKIKSRFLQLLQSLQDQGIKIREMDMTSNQVATYYVLAMAETASNLARLDGSHYGEREAAQTSRESALLTRSNHFTLETQRRIIGGNQVLAYGHAEGIYLKARAMREAFSQKVQEEFENVDILLSPVSPSFPPPLGESLDDPHAMYLSDVYTVGFSLAGVPTMTVPQQNTTGIQVTAAKMKEQHILDFALYLQTVQNR